MWKPWWWQVLLKGKPRLCVSVLCQSWMMSHFIYWNENMMFWTEKINYCIQTFSPKLGKRWRKIMINNYHRSIKYKRRTLWITEWADSSWLAEARVAHLYYYGCQVAGGWTEGWTEGWTDYSTDYSTWKHTSTILVTTTWRLLFQPQCLRKETGRNCETVKWAHTDNEIYEKRRESERFALNSINCCRHLNITCNLANQWKR